MRMVPTKRMSGLVSPTSGKSMKGDYLKFLQGMEDTKPTATEVQPFPQGVYQHSICIHHRNLYSCFQILSLYACRSSTGCHSDRSKESGFGAGKKEWEPEGVWEDVDYALPMPGYRNCKNDRRCKTKDTWEGPILHYCNWSIKQGWPIGHPLTLPQDYVVDAYLSVRLEAGTLHLANYLIRATFYCLDAKVTLFLSSAKHSYTPSGKTSCYRVSLFLRWNLLKIIQLWITGIWKPLFELPNPLEVL